MAVRFWLKTSAHELVREVSRTGYANSHTLDGMEVETDRKSGEKYINFYVDPINPGVILPVIASEYVKYITYIASYHAGFRTDGIYRYKGATARVETTPMHRDSNQGGGQEYRQDIDISARSIKTLRDIYSKIRTGELKPEENWGTFVPTSHEEPEYD